MKDTKKIVKGVVRVKVYAVISDTIEAALNAGYIHIHADSDTPTQYELVHELHTEIMNRLCDVLDFGDNP